MLSEHSFPPKKCIMFSQEIVYNKRLFERDEKKFDFAEPCSEYRAQHGDTGFPMLSVTDVYTTEESRVTTRSTRVLVCNPDGREEVGGGN